MDSAPTMEPSDARVVLRAWLEPDGLRVCRDVESDGRLQPQHMTYLYADFGRFGAEWEDHDEGAPVPCVETLGEPPW